MPAYNFKYLFVDPIRAGDKFTTIRGIRRRPTQAGDNLALYTGQRTKLCFKIADATCISTRPIVIYPSLQMVYWKIPKAPYKLPVSDTSMEEIFREDGFSKPEDFFKFFSLYKRYKLDNFEIVKWDPKRITVPAPPNRNEVLAYKKYGGINV